MRKELLLAQPCLALLDHRTTALPRHVIRSRMAVFRGNMGGGGLNVEKDKNFEALCALRDAQEN